jgi:hypothetical protein
MTIWCKVLVLVVEEANRDSHTVPAALDRASRTGNGTINRAGCMVTSGRGGVKETGWEVAWEVISVAEEGSSRPNVYVYRALICRS